MENYKVVAITEIPAGARSTAFDLSCVALKLRGDKVDGTLQVGVWQSGEISLLGAGVVGTQFWPKLIPIAPDCHAQNVRICRWQGNTVVLQATRTILTGQPLFLWFGEDLLINDLGIPPYLSPSNIRGGNSYMCNKCSREFEAPNLLKIHLASDCGTLSSDILWNRLATSAKQSPAILNLNFLSALTTFPVSTMRAPLFIPPRPVLGTSSSRQTESPLVSFACPSNHQQLPVSTTPSSVTSHHEADGQAQLESIVSNMGKAKNGHICLYCGKLYSRKYGLKIHIRTHTGYKPLKCKICQRPFGDPSNLNKHVRLHADGNTPYRCDFCGKILVRRRDLDRHIRSRHGNLRSVVPRNASATSAS